MQVGSDLHRETAGSWQRDGVELIGQSRMPELWACGQGASRAAGDPRSGCRPYVIAAIGRDIDRFPPTPAAIGRDFGHL